MAYWYLEDNYSLQVALSGGLVLAVLEMLAEWIFIKHIHTISKLNFFLILILGGIAFIFREGIWFKLQPAFTGWIMGGYLLYRVLHNRSLILEMALEMGQKILPPGPIMKLIERNMAIFMISYGSFMAVVAIYMSTDRWLFFKTVGFYICCAVFLVIQTVFIRKRIRRLAVENT